MSNVQDGIDKGAINSRRTKNILQESCFDVFNSMPGRGGKAILEIKRTSYCSYKLSMKVCTTQSLFSVFEQVNWFLSQTFGCKSTIGYLEFPYPKYIRHLKWDNQQPCSHWDILKNTFPTTCIIIITILIFHLLASFAILDLHVTFDPISWMI